MSDMEGDWLAGDPVHESDDCMTDRGRSTLANPSDRNMDGHIYDAAYENAVFLIDTCGMSEEMAAKRIGMTYDALDKLLRRNGWTKERE